MPNKQVQEKVLWCFGINDLFFHKIFCKVKIKFFNADADPEANDNADAEMPMPRFQNDIKKKI